MTYDPLTEDDLLRIERCLPPLHDDGEAGFAVTLGQAGLRGAEKPEAEFDTDDVHRLIGEVRRLRSVVEDASDWRPDTPFQTAFAKAIAEKL